MPPIPAPLRRLAEWTADYYLSPLASVLRMILPSSSALEGSRQLTEYRRTGLVPERMTPQREKALAALEGRPAGPDVPVPVLVVQQELICSLTC